MYSFCWSHFILSEQSYCFDKLNQYMVYELLHEKKSRVTHGWILVSLKKFSSPYKVASFLCPFSMLKKFSSYSARTGKHPWKHRKGFHSLMMSNMYKNLHLLVGTTYHASMNRTERRTTGSHYPSLPFFLFIHLTTDFWFTHHHNI